MIPKTFSLFLLTSVTGVSASASHITIYQNMWVNCSYTAQINGKACNVVPDNMCKLYTIMILIGLYFQVNSVARPACYGRH